MPHAKQYIIQFLGILLLVFGYLISDQPDSLSVMHFNSNPSTPSVIKKTNNTAGTIDMQQPYATSTGNTSRKTNIPKYISYEVILPVKSIYYFPVGEPVTHTAPLPENYSYLFYEEINPPPPKAC